MEKVVLCDTNILVDFYKGVERIIDELKLIQEQHIAIQHDIPLFTLNAKDFHYLPTIRLYTPSWGK